MAIRKGTKERPHCTSGKSRGMGRRCKTHKDGPPKGVFRNKGAATRQGNGQLENKTQKGDKRKIPPSEEVLFFCENRFKAIDNLLSRIAPGILRKPIGQCRTIFVQVGSSDLIPDWQDCLFTVTR